MTDHIEYLEQVISPKGLRVADIGAGSGAFCRQLAGRGAFATGVEVDAERVRAANEDAAGAFEMVCGRAEDLPLESGQFDLVCFMFSFHHVPGARHGDAVAEARRVLAQGGRLHVVEPEPFGPMTEIVKLIDDETIVRNAAQDFLRKAVETAGFQSLEHSNYMLVRRFTDFDGFVSQIVANDPARSSLLKTVEKQMREAFFRLSYPDGGAYVLEQPCATFHFMRTGN